MCEGEGTTVNPNIDAHGLTAEDFREDPDFAENYFSGTYDVPCRACGGKNAAERRMAARENGDWEGYQVAGDWRYG